MVNRRRAILFVRRTVDVLIVGLVALVLLALFLGRIVPLTGRETLIIAGGSMEPTLPIGAMVIIQPVPADALAVGDVVTLRVGPKPSVFTHRIIRSLTLNGVPYIETKGDANAAPDGATIPASAVEGRVTWTIPFAGYLVALLSVPIGVFFALVLGMTLVIFAWILDTVEVSAPGPAAAPAEPSLAADPPVLAASTAAAPRALASDPLGPGRVARHLATRDPIAARIARAGRAGRAR